MSNLTVTEFDGALVVDSRLIADELGIQHRTFIKTVRKYQTKIESRFGLLRFENEAVKIEGSRGFLRF